MSAVSTINNMSTVDDELSPRYSHHRQAKYSSCSISITHRPVILLHDGIVSDNKNFPTIIVSLKWWFWWTQFDVSLLTLQSPWDRSWLTHWSSLEIANVTAIRMVNPFKVSLHSSDIITISTFVSTKDVECINLGFHWDGKWQCFRRSAVGSEVGVKCNWSAWPRGCLIIANADGVMDGSALSFSRSLLIPITIGRDKRMWDQSINLSIDQT